MRKKERNRRDIIMMQGGKEN